MTDEPVPFAAEADDAALEALLRSHLRDALGPHVGRAREGFERAAASARRPTRWSLAYAGVGLAAAAAVAVAVLPHRPIGRGGALPAVHPTTPVAIGQHDARWQNVDAGVVRLEDGTFARLTLQRRLDRVRYFDAARNATIEYTEPHEQAVYVAMRQD